MRDIEEMRVTIAGLPQPQGSKKIVGKVLVESNEKLRPWRDHVTSVMMYNKPEDWSPNNVYMASLWFYFPRPKRHYKSDGSLKDGIEVVKASRPDLDKLIRAILDAGTDAGLWRDDCQVWAIGASKHYDLTARVEIVIKSAANVSGS